MDKVRIDVNAISKAFEKHVRQKAIIAGSTIIYAIGGQIIEEDPKTTKKIVLKAVNYTK